MHEREPTQDQGRHRKWTALLHDGINVYRHQHPADFEALTLQGVPTSLRGKVWTEYLAERAAATHPSHDQHQLIATLQRDYRRIISRLQEEESQGQMPTARARDHRQIDLDVKRTYQNHPLFRSHDGKTALRDVLRVFVCENVTEGYVQSLNYLAAICLLNTGDPVDAYVLLRLFFGYQPDRTDTHHGNEPSADSIHAYEALGGFFKSSAMIAATLPREPSPRRVPHKRRLFTLFSSARRRKQSEDAAAARRAAVERLPSLEVLHAVDEANAALAALKRDNEPIHGARYMRSYYLPGMDAAKQSMRTLDAALARHAPMLHVHFRNEGVEATIFAIPWFLTLFAYCIEDYGLLMRLWDVYILLHLPRCERVTLQTFKGESTPMKRHGDRFGRVDHEGDFIVKFALVYLESPRVYTYLVRSDLLGIKQALQTMRFLEEDNVAELCAKALRLDLDDLSSGASLRSTELFHV